MRTPISEIQSVLKLPKGYIRKHSVRGGNVVFLEYQPSGKEYELLKSKGWEVEDIDRSDSTVTKGKVEIRFVY